VSGVGLGFGAGAGVAHLHNCVAVLLSNVRSLLQGASILIDAIACRLRSFTNSYHLFSVFFFVAEAPLAAVGFLVSAVTAHMTTPCTSAHLSQSQSKSQNRSCCRSCCRCRCSCCCCCRCFLPHGLPFARVLHTSPSCPPLNVSVSHARSHIPIIFSHANSYAYSFLHAARTNRIMGRGDDDESNNNSKSNSNKNNIGEAEKAQFPLCLLAWFTVQQSRSRHRRRRCRRHLSTRCCCLCFVLPNNNSISWSSFFSSSNIVFPSAHACIQTQTVPFPSRLPLLLWFIFPRHLVSRCHAGFVFFHFGSHFLNALL